MTSEVLQNPNFSSTVLVIDDEESIRQVTALTLEFQGYQVFTAANGQEGLNLLRSIPTPFLILLDLMMPVMDGWEFMEALEKDSKFSAIPVVIVTAHTEPMRVPLAQGIIHKPMDIDLLYSTVKRFSVPRGHCT